MVGERHQGPEQRYVVGHGGDRTGDWRGFVVDVTVTLVEVLRQCCCPILFLILLVTLVYKRLEKSKELIVIKTLIICNDDDNDKN